MANNKKIQRTTTQQKPVQRVELNVPFFLKTRTLLYNNNTPFCFHTVFHTDFFSMETRSTRRVEIVPRLWLTSQLFEHISQVRERS